ncbi:Modulator of FtsH protease YccA [Novipirellula aureliae]|uniref:Modulator of FtsH protease YccA n=1 Tax=Novipirellula aureliae TaxID=2527966 RepID=A0A5C6DD45_9BACT|nr:Bax inhibitor-1 family protein [Novipirellula aureliae]TWU33611.1 Modulator of FtsH protease YccA [Novipirellula aureliae]
MSQYSPYAPTGEMAAFASESARATFIRRTYAHLGGAVLALIAIEVVLFSIVPAATMDRLVGWMLGGYGWLLVLGAFMAVSWMARSWANSDSSVGLQYAGLGLYTFAEAILLLPLLYIAMRLDPQIPVMAAVVTAVVFAGLTAFVFTTRVDLAPWGKYLAVAGLVALGAIVAGIIFNFSLGILFSALMVALASGYILYDTSNILHHYRTDQHVAASLALFASVALLFWYILRIMMMFSSRD